MLFFGRDNTLDILSIDKKILLIMIWLLKFFWFRFLIYIGKAKK